SVQSDNDPGADPVAVVGVFEATGPLAHLADTVLISTVPEDVEALRYMYLMANDITVVDRLEHTLALSVPALNPNALTVETPQGAIALRDVIAGRLGAASRQLMAVVMGVGAVIIAVTMVSATSARRRDFGRRRALGASRSALVATMLGQAALGASVGIVLGAVAGLVVLGAATGSLPTWQFTAGVAGLALLLTLATSAPIATYAAYRDPLRILRVP
ncbi:MAG: FtsX-like permease family protein, partial [Demequina sp.]